MTDDDRARTVTMIPTAEDEALWVTCWHESGHAWAVHWLLGTLGVVSVRPGAAHAGITVPDPSDPLNARPRLDRHPIYGLDPVERQRADRMLLMLLMGEAAEPLAIHAPLGGFAGRFVEPAHPTPGLPSASALPPPVAASWAAASANTSPTLDHIAAYELAKDLVGPNAAGPYVAWVRIAAREAALAHLAELHALASFLWREQTIAGRNAGDILDGPAAEAIIEAAHTGPRRKAMPAPGSRATQWKDS